MVCKINFTNWNSKIALLHASMVVTYYIKLFQMGANRHNGILMSLLLLVAETIISFQDDLINFDNIFIVIIEFHLIKFVNQGNVLVHIHSKLL